MNNEENDLLNPNNEGQNQQNNESGNNNNGQNNLHKENENNNVNEQKQNDQVNEKKENEQPKNEEQVPVEEKKKKKEEVGILANANFNLLDNEEEKKEDKEEVKEEVKEEKKGSILDQKLSSVSKSSGLNLKAYFIEESGKELEEIKQGSLGYTNFKFTGNMKEFYSKVYKHILDSNLIARQLADEKDREKLPTFQELSQQFEDLMKNIGDELVKRGHLEKYEPFGGLSANEIKSIENSCLLNRPKNEREAIERNAANVEGKNFDELVEKGYEKAADTISNFYGKDYKKGDPAKDEKFLSESANLIKGMSVLRDKEKIWNTYLPDLSAPKWNKPIYKHPISNAFKAVRRGIGIAFDGVVKFPVINALRAVRYPIEKGASLISIAYNQRKLENLVYAKGFNKNELASYMNKNEKPALNIEQDVKAVEANFKNNEKAIEEYKNKNKQQELPSKEDKEVVKVENMEPINDKIVKIEVPEAADIIDNKEIVPMIDDNSNIKQVDKVMNNV